MPDINSMLEQIAGGRQGDPLTPVTVIVPSHAAGLQMRRCLAEIGPFAAVRFETLPRIAELLAAGHLAAAHRLPLARPIGDYVAEEVARESRGSLAQVAALPGYAKALRRIFRRIRRGGIHSSVEVRLRGDRAHLDEILRLFDLFRDRTGQFYDDEDLLEEAAAVVRSGRAGAFQDLGAINVTPPGALSAGGADLLAALRESAPSYLEVEDGTSTPETRLMLAPDPASEAREVVREVLRALQEGVPLHEIAVFHGADPAYRRLLRDAFAPAGIPIVQLPGVPLSETAAGRGVLMMLALPEEDYRRTAVLDFLSIAPLMEWLPVNGGTVRTTSTAWDKISRDAGVTRGREVWRRRLAARLADIDASALNAEESEREERSRARSFEREAAADLLGVVEFLVERMESLRRPMAAAEFISSVRAVIGEYFARDALSLEEGAGGGSVLKEIDQLGTVGSVGGRFDLSAFTFALRANLEASFGRDANLGDGVIVADYRAAAGLRFQRIVLCGAFEGALPAGPGGDAIVGDGVWSRLREAHPYVEDAQLRMDRGLEAARRAVAAASGALTWTCPLYEAGGSREYYPSPMIVDAVSELDSRLSTASAVRGAPPTDPWLQRSPSPLAAMLRGPAVDRAEQQVRQAVLLSRSGAGVDEDHPARRAVGLLRARRSRRFTEWDGNLGALRDSAWLELQRAVSPTSLENYSVCGFKYLCRSLFRLRTVEEPEEREMMDPAARGGLIHTVLDRFFKDAKANGRPAVGERWTHADRQHLLALADEELRAAGERGLTGLEVYGRHEVRTICADLERFLEEDNLLRAETGAVPEKFEEAVPETEVVGVRLRGRVDRVDITPDGKRAWIIDYKTGSSRDFKENDDPLLGGKKLQLPVYLAAVRDVAEARALYWFITRKGEFRRQEYVPTAENEARFRRTLEAIVNGIGAGAFPAVSGEEDDYWGGYDNCKYCEYTRICSRRRDQEFELKGEDAAMRPWKAVGVAGAVEESGR